MAYQQLNDELKQKLWEITAKRSMQDEDCLLWKGPVDKDGLGYWEFKPKSNSDKQALGERRCVVNVRKLAYEIYYSLTLPKNERLISTCDNKLCFSKDHVVLASSVDAWDPKKARDKLERMSTRQTPTDE